jgi:hypothetical protein
VRYELNLDIKLGKPWYITGLITFSPVVESEASLQYCESPFLVPVWRPDEFSILPRILFNNNNNNNNNNNVLENDNFKLYWNRSIMSDKTIPANRPDITFKNKKTKTTYLIDIAVPNTHNLAKTITEKQNKYQELAN